MTIIVVFCTIYYYAIYGQIPWRKIEICHFARLISVKHFEMERKMNTILEQILKALDKGVGFTEFTIL